MFALFRKEISVFFASVVGYAVMAVYLLITALLLFVFPSEYNLLDFGAASMEGFFKLSPFIFLFLIPAITMRSFADEKRSGAIELLLTKPISDIKIVWAKFAAAFVLLLCTLLPTLIYVYTIQQLGFPKGNIDMGGVWGSYLGLLFIGSVFVAIGIYISYLSENQIVAFILSVLLCAAMYLGFDFIANLGVFGQSELLVKSLGLNQHYLSLGRGVIDTRDFLYCISVVFIFLMLTYMALENRRGIRVKRMPYYVSIFAGIILLNVASSFFFTRIDLTAEKRYTLQSVTKKIIKETDETVYFKIYLDGDLPSGVKRLRNATKEMLDEFAAYNSKIRYEFVDVYAIADERSRNAFVRELQQKGVQPINLKVKENGGESRKLIFPAAEISMNGRQQIVNLLHEQAGASSEESVNYSVQMLEYEFISALHRLQQTEMKAVGILAGHGELGPLNTVEAAFALASNFYIEQIFIRDNPYQLLAVDSVSGNVRPRVDVLVVPQPTKPFSEIDKWTIDQFIMHGGKVFWAIDATTASLDSLRGNDREIAFIRQLNLEDLFFKYGFRVNPDLILDLNAAPTPVVTGYVGDRVQTELMPYFYLPLIIPQGNHPVVTNLGAIRMEFASTIDTIQNDIRKTILLTSSPYNKLQAVPSEVGFDLLKKAPDMKEYNNPLRTVALLLEGKFQSAYKNRMAYGLEKLSIPMKENSDESRMIIVSDGDVIKNQYNQSRDYPYPLGYDVYSGQTYANKEFFENAINYLSEGTGLLELRARELKLRILDRNKINEEKSYWQTINVVVPVALIILLYVGVTYYRKRKYQKPFNV